MTIGGFTYVRNGFKYGYPFIPSIKSLLPLVDELIVVVGDSEDGTREAIVALNNDKIKIIDTVWDDELRQNGKIFATQSNIGLDAVKGSWAFHLQVDEVLHEQDYPIIKKAIAQAGERKEAEGLLFPFLHFWGDFEHVRNTRKTHPYEIRAFKNTGNVRSYKDSQGFRKYSSTQAYETNEAGEKLKVLKVDAPVYHYSYTRHPSLMKQKANYFNRFWHDDQWLRQHLDEQSFDFNDVDKLEPFSGKHPAVMNDVIAAKNWVFRYDPSRSNMSNKDKWIGLLNKMTGRRWFEFENYKLLRQ
ncbi:MAG: glycosyltransferase family 2 protein [Edaphocola sp.]